MLKTETTDAQGGLGTKQDKTLKKNTDIKMESEQM